MEPWVIIVIVAVAILLVVIIIGWAIGMRNGFVRKRNVVEEAFSTMDVYLKQRYDLIPNLVASVKGYMGHEKETLEAVMQARSQAMTGNTGHGNVNSEAEGQLTSTLKTLFSVAEAYPQLKADSQFINLQNKLSSLESEIVSSRKYYNATVKTFNTAVEVFPGNLIAGMMKLEKFKLFAITNDERQNVSVSFDK